MVAFIACLALGLVACGNDQLPQLTMDSVSIYTDLDANNNSATPVDLVVIYDQELVKTFGQMSASQYFTSMKQLLLDNPTLLDIWHWELVPGQTVQNFSPKQNTPKAYAAYVYANYLTDGDHRIKVSPNGIVKILLQKDDLLNLSTYDIREATPGTTMADVVSTTSKDDSTVDPTQVQLGTVTCPPEPPCSSTQAAIECQEQPPCYSTQSTASTAPVVECQGQQVLKPPIPIAQQPLCGPPAGCKRAPVSKPCPQSKVKNGKTKS
ncbi:MAG: hypothetical protein A2W46_02275 [Alphaproteobacteria bacterium RIFCSPHIGHO2_12_42_13]|nr:MAG: hypothetical protein A2Z80_02725 [Alphaproteobacteria bacterium GWA2_41_27]OFW92471.1 MAG: hypothetical protein A2W46_02275 [Alphaproteobacteria bacterium RIFCSPHIGHO2_12_42_13]OFX06749.1 MAG: hypothetical protein A3G78_02760 [Alphaproteobacteria bacterium RIFCSPLOWO2_12_FULL_42_29]HBW24348.1 hypothetical protein [Holosporales bacterium]